MKFILFEDVHKGVPSTMPTKAMLLAKAKTLKGESLRSVIDSLEYDGSWYREDHRHQKGFVLDVIENNFVDIPTTLDEIQSNYKIISSLYAPERSGMWSRDLSNRFGIYDERKLLGYSD